MAKRSRGRSASLARIPVSSLHAELRRRERLTRTLARRRDRLAARLDSLERQIAMTGGSGRSRRAWGGGAGRPRNTMTLVETLSKVLSGRTMRVTDAADAVQRAGYRTNSNNFRTQVNIALSKNGAFRRVGRGQYTAR